MLKENRFHKKHLEISDGHLSLKNGKNMVILEFAFFLDIGLALISMGY